MSAKNASRARVRSLGDVEVADIRGGDSDVQFHGAQGLLSSEPGLKSSSSRRFGVTVLVAGLVFLVALNLRPALTSVGPLLSRIGSDLGLSEGAQGMLGTLPLLAFAVISPLVQYPSRKFGMDRTIQVALVALVAGILLRSYSGTTGLWVGTVIIGAAIAVGNVIVPPLVKRDYPHHISLATSIYSACLSAAAAAASALAVPLAFAGWRHSLAWWAIPAGLVAVLWLVRGVRSPSVDESRPSSDAIATSSMWKSPAAWFITAFMGLQSTMFYAMVTWLPSIEISVGVRESHAGIHLFVFQMIGVLAGLAIPRLLRVTGSYVVAGVASSLPMVIGLLGLLIAPDITLLWVVIAGLGSGSSLVVAFSLIAVRAANAAETTQLSGMAQSLGYLLAAIGPVALGVLTQHTGSWVAGLLVLLGVATVQTVAAVAAGRDAGRAVVR